MNDEVQSLTRSEPCITRRNFLCVSCAGAGAVFLAGCGLTGPGSSGPPDSVSLTIKLVDYPALATVGGIIFVDDSSGSPLAVVRTDDATFVALSRICPHRGGTIGRSGAGFKCPNHGATFDETGTWIGGQPTSGMHAYDATFDPVTDDIVIG